MFGKHPRVFVLHDISAMRELEARAAIVLGALQAFSGAGPTTFRSVVRAKFEHRHLWLSNGRADRSGAEDHPSQAAAAGARS